MNWGVCGTGRIAGRFIEVVRSMGGGVTSVASSSKARAEVFAKERGIGKAYTVSEMANDKDIDAVYVGTNHTAHKPCAEIYINAGKPVLIEKPVTVTAAEFKELRQAAKEKNVLIMEAMWTRFLPATEKVLELLARGAAGEVGFIDIAFGFRNEDFGGRLFNPDLAGGALLDIGCYSLYYLYWLMGELNDIKGSAHISGGVDMSEALTMRGGNGAIGTVKLSVRTTCGVDCTVYGSKGKISVPVFYDARKVILEADGRMETFELDYKHGFEFQIRHFEELIRTGQKESPLLTLEQSEYIMSLMDGIRKGCGLKYPFEQ